MTDRVMRVVAIAVGAIVMVSSFLLQVERPRPVVRAEESLEGESEDPGARVRFEWLRLHEPATGTIPAGIRERELKFAGGIPVRPEPLEKGNEASGAVSTVWSRRGPNNVGGRTRALGVDITDANVILAGGVSGGLWRSVNGGASWTQSTSAGQLHSVTCLAQDKRAGHTATWYAGTGEYLGNSASGKGGASYTGDGIYKSTDNGVTWFLLPSTSTGMPQAFENYFDYVWSVAPDPSVSGADYVFAATYGAIWISADGGVSWNVSKGGASPFSPAADVLVTPSGVVYAALSSGSSADWGVWRSVDGVTWADITPGDMLSNVGRIVLGSAPSNENVLYVLAETPGAGYQTTYAGKNEAHSFWKYTYLSGDGTGTGGSWENRSGNLPNLGQPVGNFASQGGYDLIVRVKPDNENIVFVGGTNLYRSGDGFASSITSTGWMGGYATANNVSQYSAHHADQHSLVFSPTSTSTLYSGHDGGVSKTTNDLSTAVSWTSLNNGYQTTQFYSVAIDHGTGGNAVLIGGMQDNGTWFVNSTSSTAAWTQLFSGDGGFSAIADGRSSYYVSSQNGTIYRFLLDVNGSLQDYARVDPTGGSGYLFITPYALDPSNNAVMYLASGGALWRNSNLLGIPTWTSSPGTAGSTTSVNWTNMTGSGLGSSISALGVSKASPANRLYFGSSDGRVYRLDNASTAAGSTTPVDVWTGKGLPGGAYVSSIAVDPANGDRALLVFSNYSVISAYYTANAGASWTAVAGNLEESPDGTGNGPSVRWASILPYGGNTYYYVGTSTGLYSTVALNGSSTVWAQEGPSAIGNVVVDMIDTRTADGLVVVGTHGQGVFSGTASPTSVSDDLHPVTTALLQNYPNPFNPSTTIRYSVAKGDRVSLKVYDITGREVATLVDAVRSPGEYAVRWSPEGLASGTYVYRFVSGSYTETKKLLYLR